MMRVWITGSVFDPSGLPLHPNSLDLGGSLIAELAPDGSSVLFSELLPTGVAGQDLVLNPDGSLTVVGTFYFTGLNLPYGFVLRLPRGTPTGLSILGVADSAANIVTGTVAPGEYLSIYGTGLGPAVGVGMQIDPSGMVANSLGGTQVSFNGIPAPLVYAADGQINLLVPYEIAESQQVNITITTNAGSSQTGPLQVVPVQPSVLAVLNSDGSFNSLKNPASEGSLVSMLVSGAGALNPSLPDGTIAASPPPAPVLPVLVTFSYSFGSSPLFVPTSGAVTVKPAYAGAIPGTAINLLRVDAMLPLGTDVTNVAVQVGSATSPPIPLYVSTSQQ